MGNCCSFCNREFSSHNDNTPDLETMRRRQVEAAERRIAEQEQRGIKNIDAVKRQQRQAKELEKREREVINAQPTLKWQVS